ncbi:Pyrrolo-quinoline quinone [Microthyrium microscopicum]|uniref:Pyrrolo-quinoline quinone n=1 Tax=Microthyrium microscopicum TaxID=703497 RepID=A0A6A6TZZ0_9PEZI|nr:Pyrrolo-quinoline quinone [Microthyrium microscopicum]
MGFPTTFGLFHFTLIYCLSFLISSTNCLGHATDTTTWGSDTSRCGYQTNHNMDPNIVNSANFGQLFKTNLPGNFNNLAAEQIYSQPLVFTGSDGSQQVYVATSQNNIYKLDGKTGAILASRNLGVPFLSADLGSCNDISPCIGITATGVIDPATGIWYLTSKTYSEAFQNGNFTPSSPPGRFNARYYFYAINTQSSNLADSFPRVQLEGILFRNNQNRKFISGNQHSRPALALVGDYVYTGYASHCVQYNYTGAIIGHNKNTGAIIESFATQGGPEANSIAGGGVWMSGGGIAYDGSGSLFFATGNGWASQLSGTPVPGRQPPSALEEAVVHAKINTNGTLSVVDFFMPWEKVQLDGADKDLGTSPFELLPPDVFSCPNVRRMGFVTGKSGKTYVLNLDNLGGYQMGSNKLDAAILVYQNENSVYAGAGVMPLGGGYIYINVIKYQTRVFKFSCDSSGNPVFTVDSVTKEYNSGSLGIGHGTTTSLADQDGTGLYWVTDTSGLNLRIYNAVPSQNGAPLTLMKSFNIPGMGKFGRPVFGDGRAYFVTSVATVYGYGSPVQLPLNCTGSIVFPKTLINSTSLSSTVKCTAVIDTKIAALSVLGDPHFIISNLPPPNLNLLAGQFFTFNATFAPLSVGELSSDVLINTTNVQSGFSSNTPVTLSGTGESAQPLLDISPNTASFNVIVGQQKGGVNQSVIFSNLGDQPLSITNIQFSKISETGPWLAANTTSFPRTSGPFTFYNLPSSIPGNSAVTVNINYNPTTTANDGVFIQVITNGGAQVLDAVGVAGSYPKALIEFENSDGSGIWLRLEDSSTFSFGNVTENQTKQLRLRVTNGGGQYAVPLSITVSKPPYGDPGIIGAINNVDLAEGTLISAGQSVNATLFCSVPRSQMNLPSYVGAANWTMNTADPLLGKQFIQFNCNAVTEQIGPLLANGTAQFQYVGCYRENTPGRQLSTNIYTDAKNNTNEKCIAACSAAGWIFAGTQYRQECWCGNAIPNTLDLERDCNYACTGNVNEVCGGSGYFGGQAEFSLFGDSKRFNGSKISPPLSIPQIVSGYQYAGCYAENGGKAVSAISTTDTKSMSAELCAAFCASYSYFSLEFAQECSCGNSINNAVATLTNNTDCSLSCKGNNSETCGASNRAQIYARTSVTLAPSVLPPSSSSTISTSSASSTATPIGNSNPQHIGHYTYVGCYTDSVEARALSTVYYSSTMTLDLCAAQASTAGVNATFFGVEYHQECWFGNSMLNGQGPAPDSTACSFLCPGNAQQNCGAENRLTLYRLESQIYSSNTDPLLMVQSLNVSAISTSSTLMS